MQVEEAAGVDGMQREGGEAVEWCALDGDAERDEGVVDCASAVSGRVVEAWA